MNHHVFIFAFSSLIAAMAFIYPNLFSISVMLTLFAYLVYDKVFIKSTITKKENAL